MKGSIEEMEAVAQRLGDCEIATSSANWSALHDAVVITVASMPPPLAEYGQESHALLDLAFRAATPNPMDAQDSNQVCVVTMPGNMFLGLLACIDKVESLQNTGVVQMIGERDQVERLNEQLAAAQASFYEYLRSRDVGAEVLFREAR